MPDLKEDSQVIIDNYDEMSHEVLEEFYVVCDRCQRDFEYYHEECPHCGYNGEE